jgi:hypothetical protein
VVGYFIKSNKAPRECVPANKFRYDNKSAEWLPSFFGRNRATVQTGGAICLEHGDDTIHNAVVIGSPLHDAAVASEHILTLESFFDGIHGKDENFGGRRNRRLVETLFFRPQ